MTYPGFIFLIIMFGLSLYLLEKRPIKLKGIELLDKKKYPLVLIIGIIIIGLLALIGALVPFVKYLCGAGTIFAASYLVVRYRQDIDWRMKR